MNETTNEQTIPNEDDIKVVGGSGGWRFANGKICKGRVEDGSYTERNKIVGALVACRRFDGKNKDTGAAYAQVEAEFKLADGSILSCHSSLIGDDGELKSSVATNGFTWGLTQIALGEVVCITAALGAQGVKYKDKQGIERTGKPATYVNFARVKGVEATPIYKPARDKSARPMSVLEQYLELEPLLKAHPAYKEREARADEQDSLTHYSELTKTLKERGWPTPEESPDGWLSAVKLAYEDGKAPAFGSIKEVPDDIWGTMRQFMADLTDCPDIIKPVAAAAANPFKK